MDAANAIRKRGLNRERYDKSRPTNIRDVEAESGVSTTPRIQSSWSGHLMQPSNSLNLAVFRIVFGFIMAYHLYRAIFWHRTLEANFNFPELNFHFWFARGIYKPPLHHVYWLFYTCTISATCIGIGLCCRFSCLVFTVCYGYTNLLEKSRYNNHFYLYTLLSFLFLITDCNRRLSLDSLLARVYRSTIKREEKVPDKRVPLWQLYIFRFQLSVVYFYSGLAKINYDWLILGEPMRTWGYWNDFSMFKRLADIVVPAHSAQDALGYFFSINGLFFDLFISFFLLIPKLRKIGFTLSFFFHLSNHFLFKIGTFPWVMMGTHVLFLEADTVEIFLTRVKDSLPFLRSTKRKDKENSRLRARSEKSAGMRWPVKALLWFYVITQVLVPLRHWLYPGNVNWTMEGHQFSWRMMLNEEDVLLRLNLRLKSGQQVAFNPSLLKMTLRQVKRLVTDSECVLQLVQHLKVNHRLSDEPDAAISVDMWRSLNNRPYQRYANSTADLSITNYYAFHYDWILPQMPDDVIDRSQIAALNDYWFKKNFSTSFFMDSPDQSFRTYLFPSKCNNVTIHSAVGTIEVKVGKTKRVLLEGERSIIPPRGFHRVSTRGNSSSVWYYVHDCSLGHFQLAQGFLSVQAWKQS